MIDMATSVGRKTNGVADKHTPLLRNFWYLAALGDEITRTPMRRTILNHDIVMYRTEEGKPVAVQNRCPHRSFPLHKGFLKGDRIVCNYHGMEFNPDGSCGHVPALNSAPRAMRLDAYPIEQDGPLAWIWMGDPEQPDYSRLFRQDWCTDSARKYVMGYMYMKANYLGLHENLMDLTHFAFLHSKWNFAAAENIKAIPKIVEEGNVIRQEEVQADIFAPDPDGKPGAMIGPFNREVFHLVQTPAMHQAYQFVRQQATPAEAERMDIVHFMTPETATTTHYYWAMAFDKERSAVPNYAEMMKGVGEAAFLEDKEVLEWIEEIQERDHRPNFAEKIIKTDEGGIRVLRMLARMATEESQESAS